MKKQITLDQKEADEIATDFEQWSEVLESDPGDEHPWIEDFQRHARLLRDKLAGRIE